MSDAPKLKPCPFCGGKASTWTTSAYSSDSADHVIGCEECDIYTPFAPSFASETPTEEDAATWNTRSDLSEAAIAAAREEGFQEGKNRGDYYEGLLEGRKAGIREATEAARAFLLDQGVEKGGTKTPTGRTALYYHRKIKAVIRALLEKDTDHDT